MRCGVLGSLEVRDDGGTLLAVPGAKERRLLAMLVAAHPTAVTVDRLVDQLWDGDAPLTARKSLQAHVVRLRSALEPGRPRGSPGRFITLREDGYVLSAARTELDVLEFGDLCARGRAMLSSSDPAAARSALTEALDLWRGAPYADWPDAAFAETERRRLEGVRSNAVCALLEADLALGRHREAIPELERLVLEQPLREDFWSMLAVALYRSGRQGDALATVGRARNVLVEELGVSPGPGLRATEQALLEQDPALDPPSHRRTRSHERAPCAGPSTSTTASRAAPTRGSPPTSPRTRRFSAAGRNWSSGWSPGWSTARSWSCRARAGPESRRWCAPVCCQRCPRVPWPAVRNGPRWSSPRDRTPSTPLRSSPARNRRPFRSCWSSTSWSSSGRRRPTRLSARRSSTVSSGSWPRVTSGAASW